MAFIQLRNVTKEYKTGDIVFRAVDDVSLDIHEGELVMFLGDSGAGKSTLLNLLGGLDTITSGDIRVNDTSLKNAKDSVLTRYRRSSVGFVFQFYNLISSLTALENVHLVGNMSKSSQDGAALLQELGLGHRMGYFPSQLSGGEQQRVAIARALCKNPALLLCDEPTGALDYMNSKHILSLIQRINQEKRKTTIIVTHNNAIEPMAHKIVRMKSGRVVDVKINPTPSNIGDLEW